MTYKEFRTGFTFRDIRQMLWSQSDNPKDWHPGVTRRTVLGKWREIKQKMWWDYQNAICDVEDESVPF